MDDDDDDFVLNISVPAPKPAAKAPKPKASTAQTQPSNTTTQPQGTVSFLKPTQNGPKPASAAPPLSKPTASSSKPAAPVPIVAKKTPVVQPVSTKPPKPTVSASGVPSIPTGAHSRVAGAMRQQADTTGSKQATDGTSTSASAPIPVGASRRVANAMRAQAAAKELIASQPPPPLTERQLQLMASKPAPFVKASSLGPGVVMDTAHRNRSNSASKTRPAVSPVAHLAAHQNVRPVGNQSTQGAARPAGNIAAQGIARRQAAPEGLEDAMTAADDDEGFDVAAMVALSLAKDVALEEFLVAQDKAAAAAAKRPGGTKRPIGGVVDFMDDPEEDDESWAASGPLETAKRQKKEKLAEERLAADIAAGRLPPEAALTPAPASRKPSGSGVPVETPVVVKAVVKRHVPGQLVHAEVAPASAGVQVYGTGTTWVSLGVDPSFVAHLEANRFKEPTRVQQSAVPVLLSGRDALVKAPTGSGKTLAYLVPIIHTLQARSHRLSRSDGTFAVIVAPTRELVVQIHDVAVVLLKRYHYMVAGALMGGENRAHEKARLRKGVTVLSASPGRLLDHLQNTESFRTDSLCWLVLDEADRLLDLGFEQRLQEIMELLDQRSARGSSKPKKSPSPATKKRQRSSDDENEEDDEHADADADEDDGNAADGAFEWPTGSSRRQTVLTSATLHQQLSALATKSLHKPVSVGFDMEVGEDGIALTDKGGDESFTIPIQLRQSYMDVACKQRLMTLAALLRQKTLSRGGLRPVGGGEAAEGEAVAGPGKVVVFFSSCDGVECYFALLADFWKVACGLPLLAVPLLKLHGDMVQSERTSTFVKFNQAKTGVLLCTDVAARGLDFPDVSTIVQFDVPGAPAEYVHRVGRTARMGHRGEAILFLQPHERPYVDLLAAKGVKLKEDNSANVLKWLPVIGDGDMGEEDENGRPRHKAGGQARRGGGKDGQQASFDLQRRLMVAVAADPHMRSLAEDAFRSFIRSYATHSGEIKRVFHIRSLHLGHVAFSFGLKESPGMIGQSGSSQERKRKKAEAATGKLRREKKNWKANLSTDGRRDG